VNADFGLQTPGSGRWSGSSPKSVHNFFSYLRSHLTNSFCQSKHGYLAANSNYHYLKHFLPISITCKFHRATFTAKFHCLQIPTIRLYRQSPLHANSETANLLPKSITCKFTQPLKWHDIFARKKYVWKINKFPEFYTILAREIIKIPEYLW